MIRHVPVGMAAGASGHLCVDGANKKKGDVPLSECRDRSNQQFSLTKDGHIQVFKYVTHILVCIRVELVTQMACDIAPKWLVVRGESLSSSQASLATHLHPGTGCFPL